MERIGDFFLNVAQNIIRNLNQNFHHQKDTGRRWIMLELLLGSLWLQAVLGTFQKFNPSGLGSCRYNHNTEVTPLDGSWEREILPRIEIHRSDRLGEVKD